MRIRYTDSTEEFSGLSYDETNNIFTINGDCSSTFEYMPVLKLDPEYDPQDFYYLFLANENSSCTENSIYQVYIERQRIEWIFPIQALLSAEHNEAENKFFLRYAYVALCLLLQDIENLDKQRMPDEFLLEDYYEVQKNILVIDKENTSRIESFSIEDYMVSLFQHGYARKGKGNILAEELLIEQRKRINLKPISSELSMRFNINYLFEEQLSIAESEIVRFYLCYQIIELLIAAVFKDRFQKFLTTVSAETEAMFDAREELSIIAGEKYRIKCLFNDYVTCETQYKTDLNIACEKLLKLNGRKVAENYYENLYSVRCLLVHKLYSLGEESYKILDEINRPLLQIVAESLFSFKKPTE